MNEFINNYLPEILTGIVSLFSVGGMGFVFKTILTKFTELRESVKNDNELKELRSIISNTSKTQGILADELNEILRNMKDIETAAVEGKNRELKEKFDSMEKQYRKKITDLMDELKYANQLAQGYAHDIKKYKELIDEQNKKDEKAE